MIKNMKKRYRLIIQIGLVILVACSVVGVYKFVDSTPSVKEAITLATTRKPETLTELYFENHLNLPKYIKGSEQYKFTFTIHNLENKDMDYSYIIYKEIPNQKITIGGGKVEGENKGYTYSIFKDIASQKTTLEEGKVSIKKDEYKSIEKTIGPLENLRTDIVVELVDMNQHISFWMDKQ